METEVHSPVEKDVPPRLFSDWEIAGSSRRNRDAGLASLVVHAVAVVGLLLVPRSAFLVERAPETNAAPVRLMLPPRELTQPTPNKGPITPQFQAEAMAPRPRIQIPHSPPSTRRAAAPAPSLPVPKPSPAPHPALPEPPRIEASERPAQVDRQQPVALPPLQFAPPEKPKIAFESPAAAAQAKAAGHLLGGQSGTVSEAVRTVARGGSSGGITVGDAGVDIGGIGEAMNLPPSPGKNASALELLSDPMGVDFRPYLINILSSVRRNWWAVMPESAKFGRSGKVVIQFSISREGRVPKLVIVTQSGTEALDRAAVAGISASNPFPPLPTEYRGDQVRLQFIFSYNVPANR